MSQRLFGSCHAGYIYYKHIYTYKYTKQKHCLRSWKQSMKTLKKLEYQRKSTDRVLELHLKEVKLSVCTGHDCAKHHHIIGCRRLPAASTPRRHHVRHSLTVSPHFKTGQMHGYLIIVCRLRIRDNRCHSDSKCC